MKRTLIIILGLISLAAIAGLLGGVFYGWPILRDRQYRELIANFQRAQRREKIPPGDASSGWSFQIPVPEKQPLDGKLTTAIIRAAPYPGVVRVNYGDESNERPLYKYVDYSSPVEIRTADDILYVYWTETLIHSESWLLVYDLAGRREIVRRRVNPDDLAQVQ